MSAEAQPALEEAPSPTEPAPLTESAADAEPCTVIQEKLEHFETAQSSQLAMGKSAKQYRVVLPDQAVVLHSQSGSAYNLKEIT